MIHDSHRRLFVLAGVFLVAILLSVRTAKPAEAISRRAVTLVKSTNEIRSEQNLPTLRRSTALERAALAKANDMFKNQYLSHSRDHLPFWWWLGADRRRFGRLGENIAYGRIINVKTVASRWLDSGEHRRNLLNPAYTHVGVAVVNGRLHGQPTTIAVDIFGRKTSRSQTIALAPGTR